MIQLTIAIGVYIVFSTSLFVVLHAMEIEPAISIQVYPAFAVLVPILFEILKERRDRDSRRAGRQKPVAYEVFGIHPILMFLYSIFVVVSIIGFALAIAETQGTAIGEGRDIANAYLGFLFILIIFLVAKWIAQKCRRSVLYPAGITTFWGGMLVYALYSGREYMTLFDVDFIVPAVIFLIFIGLAFWWGRKRRIYSYVEYLYRSIDYETQISFLELMREEVEQLTRQAIHSDQRRENA